MVFVGERCRVTRAKTTFATRLEAPGIHRRSRAHRIAKLIGRKKAPFQLLDYRFERSPR
jgi:hypothetical protein